MTDDEFADALEEAQRKARKAVGENLHKRMPALRGMVIDPVTSSRVLTDHRLQAIEAVVCYLLAMQSTAPLTIEERQQAELLEYWNSLTERIAES